MTDSHSLQHQHAIEQNLCLAGSLIEQIHDEEVQLNFPLQIEDQDHIETHLSGWHIRANKAVVCIHPGSGASSKVWRGDKWASVADAISSRYEAAIVFSGAESESGLIGEIAAKMKQGALSSLDQPL